MIGVVEQVEGIGENWQLDALVDGKSRERRKSRLLKPGP